MTDLRRSTSVLASLALVLAAALLLSACGGGAGATSASSPGGGAGATSASSPGGGGATPTAADGATANPGTGQTPGALATPGGGGTALNACDYLTTAEVASVTGSAALIAERLDGEPSYCFYNLSDATTVVATYVSHKGAKTVYDAYAASGTKIPGLGDGAVWDTDSRTLFILKGDTLLSLTAGSAGTEASVMLDYAKQLGPIMLSRA